VYGCEFPPYKLPKYLHVRIFALEYIRKMINYDGIHFVPFKKKQQLRIKRNWLFHMQQQSYRRRGQQPLEIDGFHSDLPMEL
jgi:hypothetical protein